MPRTRAQTKAATRVALISAGITEFAHHGFDVSLDAISARAKVTRGAFYVHFADRDAFIVAVMEHVLGTFVALLTGPAASLTVEQSIVLFMTAVRSRAPVVTGGSGLRFHHVLEACRRSRPIGNAYRNVIATARATIVTSIKRDQTNNKICADRDPEALGDLFSVIALGMLVTNELDLALDLDRIEAAMLGVLT